MKWIKELILFLFFCTNTFTQSIKVDEIVSPQGFGIGLLNYSGNSSIINNVSNVGLINPAAVSNFGNYSFGFSYQLNSNIEEGWINNSIVKRQNDFLPQSVGGIVRWNDIILGAGYQQKYNIDVDFTDYSNGACGNYSTHFKGRVHSYSIVLAYSLNKIMNDDSYLDIGLNYSFNKVIFSMISLGQETKLNDNSGNAAVGIQYTNKNQDDRKTKIGLSYTFDTDFEAEHYYYSDFTGVFIHPDGVNAVNAVELLSANIPDKFNLDFSKELSDVLTLNVSAAGIFWKRDNNNLKDQLEFSASAVYKLDKTFSPALGFYYTDKKYGNDIFNFGNKFNSIFIIAGFEINSEFFSANISFADSHLFSGDYRKQTIGKLSIGINL